MIRVFLCNSNTIILEGLKSIIKSCPNFTVVGSKTSSEKLLVELTECNPDVIIIDYSSEFFELTDIKKISTVFPNIKMIGITDYNNKNIYKSALGMGLHGHLLNCCDKAEIRDAIDSVYTNHQFYCGKVLETINNVEEKEKFSCAPIILSERELEIIVHIAEGLTNKEIADKLFLSTHTVMTHRKNIMNKLGLTNTASLVLYAVRQQLISPNKFLFETA